MNCSSSAVCVLLSFSESGGTEKGLKLIVSREPSIQQVSGAEEPGDLLLNTSLRKLSKGICLRVSKPNMPGRAGILYHGLQFYLVLQIIAMLSVFLTWNI